MKYRITYAIMGATCLGMLQAEEGGAGHYIPGSMSTLIDLPPTTPGWITEVSWLHYQGDASASRAIPIGGLLVGNLDATSDALLLGGFHTFENQIAGAWYSIGMFVPWVWMEADASLSLGSLNTHIHDHESGLGDIAVLPLLMGWKCGEWQYNAALPIYTPTGEYEKGRLANPGRNHWTFDPTVGISYSGSQSLVNSSFHTGFSINTENKDTDYKSGTVWHNEFSVQKLYTAGSGLLGVGFNAFYYQQITGDSGGGANLGDFEGRTIGIGPVLTFLFPRAESNFVGEIR
ncbi:transporter [Luteolibacter pohnpeiensis]|uniref:Transporter n=1 Tax=Luteolibacter pohnpeiensis TaxID=454153 RepID=A0A934S2Y0_9BACT|nr:transporter [Luteolibacter pohnpeiensis]MBK1880918.1 transporter [Luteolibacter pohnpeiensis]